ncbi:MAG: Internalin-A [Chloroflexi bacterium]|nr:Internalin-A [Chloroflexota bacterium]
MIKVAPEMPVPKPEAEPDQEVTFPDPNLEAAIREALGLGPDVNIYRSDLDRLTYLWAQHSNIADLTGLEYTVNLTWLDLERNQITDISGLANLTSLTWLGLSGNQISDLSPLANLTGLTLLWLGDNQISDISPLANLTNLTWLSLWGNQISDISPLANLTSLIELGLWGNQISNLSPLANLTSLTWLGLEHNQISDLSPLAALTGLEVLVLGDNHISDISPLVDNEGLSQGDEIDLRGNPLSEASLNTHIPQLVGRGVAVLYDIPPIIEIPLFRPYPHGFSFRNRSVIEDSLTWSCRVRIFMARFDTTGVDARTVDQWIYRLGFGTGGSCYGMALASLMEYAHPGFDQLLEESGNDFVYDLTNRAFVGDGGRWDASGYISDRPILKHVVGLQITQHSIPQGERIIGAKNVLNTLKREFPDQMYILSIFDKGSGHALVPFHIETITENQEYRVYVYDPNHPGDKNRAVIIRRGLLRWHWEYEMGPGMIWSGPAWWGWRGDSSIVLIPISTIYRLGTDGFRLPGWPPVDEHQATVFLTGEANLLLRDSQGRMTGFKDGIFLEEIPYVYLKFPMGALLDEEPARWQPGFCVSKDFYRYTDRKLTFVIEETENAEEFSLIKFGKNYFVKFEASTGKEDINVNISYDGTEVSITGQEDIYSLILNRNIDGESLTFTATDIPTAPEQIHRHTIVWDVPPGYEEITLQIDTDGDGVVEYEITADKELTPDEEGFPPALTTIVLTPEAITLEVGEAQTFAAETLDQFGDLFEAPVSWAVVDELVGTIDEHGVFTALAAGTTTITATSDGVTGTATVTVILPPRPAPLPINWGLIGGLIAAGIVVGLVILFWFRRRGTQPR